MNLFDVRFGEKPQGHCHGYVNKESVVSFSAAVC